MWSEFLFTAAISLYHFMMTLPSVIYHGIPNKYLAWRSQVHELYIPAVSSTKNELSIDCKCTLVLVHGRNGHWTSFRNLVKSLQIKCPAADILGVNLGDNGDKTVAEDSDFLSKRLEEINGNLILIGLSKGGLIVSRYAVDNSDRVLMVITISSPLQGTQIASVHPWNKLVRDDLGWHSVEICKLMDQVSQCKVPFYHIVPTWDHMIIPSSGAKYPSTPDTNIYTYRGLTSHMGIPHIPEVIDQIVHWIAQPYAKLHSKL